MLRSISARLRRLRMQNLKPFGRRVSASFRIHLCDADASVAAALATWFRDADDVEVVCGDLLALDCDALVSPANSFGDMSGGLDKAIDDFHRGAAQPESMRRIADRWYGELPVGAAEVVEIPSARRFPFLVVAPTMRVPGRIAGSINAYLAFRAALIAVSEHNRNGNRPIAGLAASGMGTGVGAMTGDEAAAQMRAAYDMIVLGGWKRLAHPIQAPFAASTEYRPLPSES